MDRVIAISLSLSLATHLAVGGFASQYEQASTQASNRLSITLHPVSVTSHNAQPSTSATVPSTTTENVARDDTQALTEAHPQPAPHHLAATSPLNPPVVEPEKPTLAHNTPKSQQTDVQTHDDTETRQQIQQGLHRLFNTHFYYPRMAQRRGIEGIVHIGLHISASGEISGIHLSKGSGMDILDKAALQSAQRITLYPESAGLLKGKSLDLVMPVKFQLSNG